LPTYIGKGRIKIGCCHGNLFIVVLSPPRECFSSVTSVRINPRMGLFFETVP
jgi:hypothetical protein